MCSSDLQLADVTNAKQSIEQLIARIDDESRRLLGETIETVRGHFRELFERVFGGGQADIVLDPDMDLLETSVEIVARPPGKEPRSISLLSGGEKTMTCVALLLAIFRSRPSPFCVLDEIPGIILANVDDLSKTNDDNLSKRRAEVPKAVQIIDDHLTEFVDWLNSRKYASAIKSIKEKLNHIGESGLVIAESNTSSADYQNKIQKIGRAHV